MTRKLPQLIWLIAAWFGLMAAGIVAAEDRAPAAPAPTAEQIAEWISALDSNRYLEREKATQQLLAVGPAALDPLLAAAQGNRPEPADRAVWILKRLGGSSDFDVAMPALDRLIRLERRPTVVQEAKETRERLREQICEKILSSKGAHFSILEQPTPEYGEIRMVIIELPAEWRGTAADWKCLEQLGPHHFFRLEGGGVGDEEVKMFEGMNDLVMLQLFRTHVTPAEIDTIKEKQPKAIVYVRNEAMLGIGGITTPKGVAVNLVQPGAAAANAGIVTNDVITTIGGKPVVDFDRLTVQIGQYKPGDQVDVSILRGKEQLTKRVTLGTWGGVAP